MNNQNGNAMTGLLRLCEWLAKLAYINLLWLLFTLIGLVILGLGPATVSAFIVIRRMLHGQQNQTIWNSFTSAYRENFWLANGLIAVIGSVYLFVLIDFGLIRILPDHPVLDYLVSPVLMILICVWTALSGYTLALFSQYKLRFWSYFSDSFWLIALFPFSSIGMIFALFTVTWLLTVIPAMLPFYLVSIPILMIQWVAKRSFNRLEGKKLLLEKMESNH
ncbi:YesL family protein [Amphibacillus sediminis]|uniref:YesL family protein n=1 Tax=Amphibacillus sediminis TaxID=360185 RepID=UPI00083754FF|nr:DUF624 domain-containing protein [Amphibacillus sediminis]